MSTQAVPPPSTPPSPQPGEGKKSRAEVWAGPVLGFLGGIAVALIGGFFTLQVAGYGKSPAPEPSQSAVSPQSPASSQSPVPSQGPPEITIGNERELETAKSPVTLAGHVTNLGPGQMVWPFGSIPRSSGSGIDPAIYAYDGPCPVNDKGNWECSNLDLASGESNKGVGKQFKLFAAVIDDSEAPRQIELTIARSKGDYRAMSGVTEHPPGVAEDSVLVVKR